MKDIDLVKLKELALAASSGCWHQETEHECPWNVVDENGIQVAIMQQRTTIRDNPKQTDRAANAAFIAGANPAVILALIEQLEAAQRERDESNERLALVREQRDAEINRNTELEAGLKRRDEQEPVAWAHRLVNKHSGVVHPWVYGSSEKETSEGDIFCVEVIPLYAAALLPPEMTMTDCVKKRIDTEFKLGYNQAISDAKALVCQPEKVVALPSKVNGESVEYGGSGAFTMGKQCGINEGIVRCAAALDAAGVKWVEGE